MRKSIVILLASLACALTAHPAGVPVIIVCGQSNSDGRVPLCDYPAYMQTDQCLYCYDDGSHFQDGQFKPYTPYTWVAGDSERFGYDAFVYHYLQKAWQQPFYVVKLTLGGTAIDPSCTNSNGGKYWSCNPEWYDRQTATSLGGKSLMKAFERSFEACRTQTLEKLQQGYDVKAILWHQGESDSTADGPANYHQNLTTLIAHMRQFLYTQTGNEACLTLPFILGTVPHISKQYNATVEQAHLRIAREDDNVIAIDMSQAQLLGDDLHFNVESAHQLGRSVFNTLADLGIVPETAEETIEGEITADAMVNASFELATDGQPNPRGTVCRGAPYGWTLTPLPTGNSFGINKDAVNFSGDNVCWVNATPLPDDIELAQTIPTDRLGAGRYVITCKLWVEVNKKDNCRLFAKPLPADGSDRTTIVQYYGWESDYTNLLEADEEASYAGFAGGSSGNFILRPLRVEVTLTDGDALTVGIRSGNRRNNGAHSTDNAGWFKVDDFHVYRISDDTNGIPNPQPHSSFLFSHSSFLYDLQGRRVTLSSDALRPTLQKGIYILNGKKITI
jgi:hypothetical protein